MIATEDYLLLTLSRQNASDRIYFSEIQTVLKLCKNELQIVVFLRICYAACSDDCRGHVPMVAGGMFRWLQGACSDGCLIISGEETSAL